MNKQMAFNKDKFNILDKVKKTTKPKKIHNEYPHHSRNNPCHS